jgi:hypothetical protein
MRTSDMNDIHDPAWDRGGRLEDLAAELTSAVYPLLLRHRPQGSWLTVELGLWRALAETVEQWARQRPSAALGYGLEAWRDGLLADLTDSAVCVALNNGIDAFQAEVRLGLYQAFRQAILRCSHG